MADDVVRIRVVVDGVVQGVFFRASAREEAERLGVGGWVRNLPDGSVEAVFEGPEPRVLAAVDWASHGPRSAIVESIETFHEQPLGEIGFRMRH